MSWLRRNAEVIEALAASATAITAVAAVAGVIIQLQAAEEISAAQSAREGFATHLSLSVANPDFAQPEVCDLLASPKAGAYRAYVSHLMFAAEQMLEVGSGWEDTFYDELEPHAQMICHDDDFDGDSDKTQALIAEYRAQECAIHPPCGVLE